ncbi:MAG TPA: zinc ribbon domain-containing protein [Vicinamibacterales bacterium]|nr:zinc ribbon domain-containing protein [Vicinamibacterales bacterium]
MIEEVRVEPASTSVPEEGFRPWHFFVLASILLATVAVLMARQSSPSHLILISLTIAAAGAAAGAFYRMLAPLTAPVVLRMGAPVSERTRTALEREKALVLRSIKELEFDRAMGKVSQNDFDEMAGRLRARALSLMKQLDLGSAGYAEAIDRELQKRLKRSAGTPGRSRCACGTSNDTDAAFCKACGTRLRA